MTTRLLHLALATVCFVASLALTPASSRADTHQTVPSANFSFMSDLQNFLRVEDANRYADLSPSLIVEGGLHGTVAGLTGTPTALTAYLSGIYITESGSITYPDNSTCWVIVHKDTTGNIGSFVRVSGTHYLLNCSATSQPARSSDAAYLIKVTTSGGAITAVGDYRALGGKAIDACASYVSLDAAISAVGSTPQILIIANCTLPSISNVTVPSTLDIVIRDTGRLCVASSTTTTINSTLSAPLRTIFPCGGSVVFGATSRTTVIPNWYGAIGDNSTNNATALNAALYSGRTVFIPCGIYRITGTLTYRTSNQSIIGEGDCSIIYFTLASANGFIPSGVLNNVQFRNFQIWGAATDESNIHICIYTDVTNIVTDGVVSNVTFAGPNATTGCHIGVKLEQDSHRWRVVDNRFTTIIGKTSTRGYGVLVGKSYYHLINHNEFIGTDTLHGRHGVYLTAGASHNIVAQNTIQNYNSSAIVINTTTVQGTSTGNLIANNKVVNGGSLANADLAAIEIDGNAADNQIVGNHIYAYQANGILITDAGEGGNSLRNVIENNYIYGARFHGIRVCGTKSSSIIGNIVINASQAAADTYDGINVTSACAFGSEVATDTSVSSNTVLNTHHHHAFHIDTTSPIPTGTLIGLNNFGAGNVGTVTFGNSTVIGPKVFTSINAIKGLSVSETNANNVGSDCLFAAATTCVVTFPTAEPNTDYRIFLSCNGNKTFWWSSRATTGFTINASSSSSDNCSWFIIRGATQ